MPVPDRKICNLFTKKKSYPRWHYQVFTTYRFIDKGKNNTYKDDIREKHYISAICEIWRNVDGGIEKLQPVHGFVSSGKHTVIGLINKAINDVNLYDVETVSPDSKHGKLILMTHVDFHRKFGRERKQDES